MLFKNNYIKIFLRGLVHFIDLGNLKVIIFSGTLIAWLQQDGHEDSLLVLELQ